MSVTITKIKDPFNLDINEKSVVPYVEGQGLDYYFRDINLNEDGIKFVISRNGVVVTDDQFDFIEIKPEDFLSIVAKTEAPAIAAWVTGYATMTAAISAGVMAAVAYGAVYIAATLVIGYAMSALCSALGPDAPKAGAGSYGSGSEDAAAQTYGWGELYQGRTENARIPILFGANKVAGHEINKFATIDGNKEILNVLLAICDHSIDSITDVRINDQPHAYFREIEVIADRLGSNSDAVIDGFDEVVGQSDIGSKLLDGTPVTQQTDGNAVEKLRIFISAPNGFYYTSDTGGMDPRTATFSVEYRVKDAADWILDDNYTMTGQTTQTQRKIVEIDDLTPAQYEVKIARTNAAETSYRGNSDIHFAALQEIVKESLIYPGLAKYAIKALATDQLSGGQPRFTCIAARDYVSVWDKSLATPAWVNKRATSPAWMAYALLVQHVSPKIDKDRLIWDDWKNWADYCDETVDGGYRFDGATVLFSGDAWSNLQKIARLGRAVIIRRGTKYGVFLDAPNSVVSHMFTMGNIKEGTFNIQYLAQKDRANAVEVEYTDPDKDYTRQVVCVYSDAYLGVTAEGQAAQVAIDASISEAEAVREAVFRINSNKYLNRVVTFDASVDSFGCTVGDLFYFQHEIVDYETGRVGSRILDAGNDDGSGNPYVQLDQEVEIESGITYKIMVRLSDDTLVEKTVNNAVGTTDTLTVTVAWLTIPEAKDLFLFGNADTYKKIYRLLNITRKDDMDRTVSGIEYLSEIYTENDSYIIDVPPWITRKQKAVNVILNEFLSYAADGTYKSNINVSWTRGYTTAGVNWGIWLENTTATTDPIKIGESFENSFVINSDLVIGDTYKVYVSVLGEGAVDTDDNTESITIQGKLAPPADVVNFAGTWNSIKRNVAFTWAAVSDLDFDYYEIREGATWATATKVLTSIDNSGIIYIDEGVSESITYRIKAVDKSGIESDTEDTCVVPIDTTDCPLSTPGGLALVSSSIIASDGGNIVTLLATWNSDSESSDYWHHYQVQLEDMTTNKKSSFSTNDREFRWELIANRQYGVAVRAVDVSGNVTPYCTQVLHTTTKDSSAPATPAWLATDPIIAGFKVIAMIWHHNTETDMSHYIVERSTVSDFASDITILGAIKASFHSDSMDLEVSTAYYYRLKAVDTSGNASAYSAIQTATTLQIGQTDIAVDGIIADHINVTNLAAIKAVLGTITSGRLQNAAGTTYFDLDLNRLKLGDAFDFNDGVLTLSGGGGGITYITEPTTPYVVGELWQDSTSVKYCSTARATGAFDADDWTVSSTNNSSWGHASDTTKIDGGDIYTDTVTASSISSISANLGTITAGLAKSSDDKFQVDFSNKWLRVYGDTEIVDEEFTSDHDVAVVLDYDTINAASVEVTTVDGGTTYTEDTDYTINYDDGQITVLSTGSMADATVFEIDYIYTSIRVQLGYLP
ncbi:MAG: hypothetical protein KAI40_03425 [Desulfobacterales bacterium]|nr:hypothetical protein [Desulfobacterales bacterium]